MNTRQFILSLNNYNVPKSSVLLVPVKANPQFVEFADLLPNSQIQRTDTSDYIHVIQRPVTNVKAIFSAENLRIKFWQLPFESGSFCN